MFRSKKYAAKVALIIMVANGCQTTQAIGDKQAEVPSSSEVLTFDRQKMVFDGYWKKVEGYWADNQDPAKDSYKGKYPFPQKHAHPWPTQEEFLRKLSVLESKAKVIGYRGLSPSRFEDLHVGSREYQYKAHWVGKLICWPEAFGPYYVEKFNVKPSKEFYDWVMNNPDADDIQKHRARL